MSTAFPPPFASVARLAVLCMGLSVCQWAGAQTSTVTGTFLGQQVSPVMAVELDAAPERARSAPSAAPASPTLGTRVESNVLRPVSPATYTGVESSHSLDKRFTSPPVPERR